MQKMQTNPGGTMYEPVKIPKSDLPEGRSGPWQIKRFEVTEQQAQLDQMRCALKPGGAGRGVKAGTYTMLKMDGSLDPMMSDTPAEINDHYWFVSEAEGNVLVTGLGLGIVANALALKPEVKKVTVIEIDTDVINLVANHLTAKHGDKLEIIQADAFTWIPPQPRKRGMFDCAWHDIWPSICSDNWDEMKRLKRHYQNWIKRQECWVEDMVKHYRRVGY
jgi:hypothetical protein